jgi:NAD(P)-dependent dehydrogenase (short-subunit alcohol dehydrogenase family)
MLKQQGWKKVVVLRFPETLIPRQDSSSSKFSFHYLNEVSEEEIITKLKLIEQNEGTIGSFIHLHPASNKKLQIKNPFPETEKSILQQVFFIAKHLKVSLNDIPKNSRNCFVTITRMNGSLGFGKPADFSAVAGGFNGLVKTANIEWPTVFCRAIDFVPHLEKEEIADRLHNELFDSDLRLTEVGYSDESRVTLQAEIDNLETPVTSNIDENSVFLVAGGARGVTATCVIELAERYQSRFILLGRTKSPINEPDWAEGVENEADLKKKCMEAFIAEGEKPTPVKINNRLKPIFAGREIRKTLETIQSKNAKAEYLSVDILNHSQLDQNLEPVIKRLGSVTGIIHGAGVLADKPIAEKNVKDYQSVVSTKIEGLHSLMQSVEPNELKHLVLFSSAAGFFGNEAQSDYAVANEILNKFAQQVKAGYPNCHVSSINWGPWDGGMVTPQLKNMFEQRNIKVIPPAVGAGILADELAPSNDKTVQIVVGSSMVVAREPGDKLLSHDITRQLTLKDNPFLYHHVIGGEPVIPIICALSWMADSCEQLYPGFFMTAATDIKVLKGIVFQDKKHGTYHLKINELEKTSSNSILLEVAISSQDKAGKPVFHYSSNISLSQTSSIAPSITNMDISETESIEGNSFYTNSTLFHGPMFQAVKKQLNINSNRLTLLCQVDTINENEKGQFKSGTFNPFGDDAQLQALLIWARNEFQAGSLPLTIKKAEFFNPTPFETPYYTSLNVKSASETKLIADVSAHDGKGKIYSQLLGAEAIISKSLNEKFGN